jgi:hypothetical protein
MEKLEGMFWKPNNGLPEPKAWGTNTPRENNTNAWSMGVGNYLP